MLLYYLGLGFNHITDIYGYDHILFIAALVCVYYFRQWREILTLITAFTIGHSITLALATLEIVYIPSAAIEFLIPVTIFITSISNFFYKEKKFSILRLKYPIAMFFGLIHGMGFSNYLRSVLSSEESLFMPLLGFNIGVELGQIIIVAIILFILFLIQKYANVEFFVRNLAMSGIIAGMSVMMVIDRYPQFRVEERVHQEEVKSSELTYCYPENEALCDNPDSAFFIEKEDVRILLPWRKDRLLVVFKENKSFEFINDFFSQFNGINQISEYSDSIFLIRLNDSNCCTCLNMMSDFQIEEDINYCSPVVQNSDNMDCYLSNFSLEKKTGDFLIGL